jgi:hypothetical protein
VWYTYSVLLFQDAAKARRHISQTPKSIERDSGPWSCVQKGGEPTPKRTRRNDADVDEDRDNSRNVKTQNSERDEFSIFGEHVAIKLRNLKDRRLQSVAQFEISSILFQVEMGNFRNLTQFSSSSPSPTGVQGSYVGTLPSQVPSSTNYTALSPVVVLQSASPVADSPSPAPQVQMFSPRSLHSSFSAAEDTETKSINDTATPTAVYTEEIQNSTDQYILA